MNYQIFQSVFMPVFKCRRITLQTLTALSSADDFRKLLLRVANEYNMNTNVIVKCYARDINDKQFYINCLNRRHLRIRDLMDEELRSVLDEVMTALLNSNETLSFPAGTIVEIQFFMCTGDGALDIPLEMAGYEYN